MTLIPILSGVSENKTHPCVHGTQRGWGQTHAQYKKKWKQGCLGKVLSATKERWNEVLESTPPQTEVVMETLTRKQAVGFWKLDEARLDGKREGKAEAPEWSQTLKKDGVIMPPLYLWNYTSLLHAWSMTDLKGQSVPPGDLWVNVWSFLLWHCRAHDSSCRTMWQVGGLSFKRFPKRIGSVSISDI